MIGTENAAALPLGPEFGAVYPFEVLFLVFSVQIIAVTMSPKIEVSFQNFLYFIFLNQQRIRIVSETRHSRLRCVNRDIYCKYYQKIPSNFNFLNLHAKEFCSKE